MNGYGAPKDPLNDENLSRYLTQVIQQLKEHRDTRIDLYLAGGYTNRTDCSEAEAMQAWLLAHGVDDNVHLHLIDHTMSAADNMRAFKHLVGDVPVLVLCEQSRVPSMRFFANHLFSQNVVFGIAFDAASMSRTHRWKQSTVKVWIEALAWHLPPVDVLRRMLRDRHIRRARAATN